MRRDSGGVEAEERQHGATAEASAAAAPREEERSGRQRELQRRREKGQGGEDGLLVRARNGATPAEIGRHGGLQRLGGAAGRGRGAPPLNPNESEGAGRSMTMACSSPLDRVNQGHGDEGHGLDPIQIEQKDCRLEAERIFDRGRRQLDR